MTENIEVFTQSSIRIRGSGVTVYADPFRMESALHDADYVFITHDHYDHFSPEDIAKVCRDGTTLVLPEGMKETAEGEIPRAVTILTVAPNASYLFKDMEFETVPAYNKLKPFHPKGAGWVGYILHLDGKRIYIAGDTDATEEAKQVRCDIALVPIGGTYTMNAKQAAALINAIRPETAIPTHYGSIVGKKEDAGVFAENVDGAVRVEIKL